MVESKEKWIAFRTDASVAIGIGHVMRCLTLANTFKKEQWRSVFVCRQHQGHLADLIIQQGHEVILLPVEKFFSDMPTRFGVIDYTSWLGSDWLNDAKQTLQALNAYHVRLLVVDHYALDAQWEDYVRNDINNLMVIDDLANREHSCDFLLDQNLGRTAKDYVGFIPDQCHLFIGSQFTLLRPEFLHAREDSLARRVNPELKRLLISLGGTDPFNITGEILSLLHLTQLPPHCIITVVMGGKAPYINDIKKQAKELPWVTEVRVDEKNMADLMMSTDLAIGAAGSTSWERCCLGLPALIVILAENQEEIAAALARRGAVLNIGNPFSNTFKHDLICTLNRIVDNPTMLQSMSQFSSSVVDGHGAEIILNHLRRNLL